MTDNLYINQSEKLITGIRKVSDAVKITMGTGGANAIIEAIENPGHLLTNDGWTIANSIKLADPIEEMGRRILLEAINRANKQSGDGSSTTCLLTASILQEGIKHLNEVSPMELKRSLEECLPLIEESINKQKREITVDSVGQVATISAEDEKIGAMIQEIYQKIGKDGLIYWDISKTTEDSYTIGTGITVEGAGYASPYMCDATENGQSTNLIRIKNPMILLTKQKISSASEFNIIAATLNGKDIKDLVVFCDEYDPLIMADLVRTRMAKGFRIILVKMPVLWKDWWYEDLAIATGAKVVSPESGLPMKEVRLEHLGTVENLVITKDASYFDGIADVSAHIETLKSNGDDDSMLRASRLNTQTARYFVGAASDSALSYRRLKVEDAISAAWQALQNGVVAGGGICLLNTSKELPNTIGGKILSLALWIPLAQIIHNTGSTYSATDPIFGGERGFNSRTQTVVDMFEAGIIDPANVVLNSVRNAISVAASILTASVIVTLPREEQHNQQL